MQGLEHCGTAMAGLCVDCSVKDPASALTSRAGHGAIGLATTAVSYQSYQLMHQEKKKLHKCASTMWAPNYLDRDQQWSFCCFQFLLDCDSQALLGWAVHCFDFQLRQAVGVIPAHHGDCQVAAAAASKHGGAEVITGGSLPGHHDQAAEGTRISQAFAGAFMFLAIRFSNFSI